MGTQEQDTVRVALHYAALGWHVFPTDPASKQPHGCLPSPGDGPGPNGKSGVWCGTSDRTQVEEWWSVHPDAGIGLSLRGLAAFDMEGPQKGEANDPAEVQAIIADVHGPGAFGPVPVVMAATPSGGRHVIYALPEDAPLPLSYVPLGERLPEAKAAGLDDLRRGPGQYVVLPSGLSDDADSQGRFWIKPPPTSREDMPVVPPWVIEPARRKAERDKERANKPAPEPQQESVPRAEAYIAAAEARTKQEGDGLHSASLALAVALGKVVASGLVTEQWACHRLRAVLADNGVESRSPGEAERLVEFLVHEDFPPLEERPLPDRPANDAPASDGHSAGADGQSEDGEEEGEEPASAWQPVSPVAPGGESGAKRPAYIRSVDGRALIYRGARVIVSGEPEVGKSWLSLVAATEVLADGGTVLFLDADDMGAAAVVERLRSLGSSEQVIDERVRWATAEGLDEPGGLEKAAQHVVDEAYDLVVVDTWDPLLEAIGLKPEDNNEVNQFHRRFTNVVHAAEHKPTLVFVDHVVKNKENRGKYSGGAGSKLRPVEQHFSVSARAEDIISQDADGLLTITVAKNRPGRLERKKPYRLALRHTDGLIVPELTTGGLADIPSDRLVCGVGWATGVMEKVSAHLKACALAGDPWQKTSDIKRDVGGNNSARHNALLALHAGGWVEVKEEGQTKFYRHVSRYHEGDEPGGSDDAEVPFDADDVEVPRGPDAGRFVTPADTPARGPEGAGQGAENRADEARGKANPSQPIPKKSGTGSAAEPIPPIPSDNHGVFGTHPNPSPTRPGMGSGHPSHPSRPPIGGGMGCVGHGAPAGAPSETASRSSESPSAGSPEHAAEQAERLFDGEVIEVIEVDPDLDAGGAPRRAPSPAEGKARPHLNPMVQRHAQRIDDALAAGASFARVGIRTRLGVDEGDLAFERAWAEVVAERAGEGEHPVDQPPPRAGGAA